MGNSFILDCKIDMLEVPKLYYTCCQLSVSAAPFMCKDGWIVNIPTVGARASGLYDR